MGGRRVFQLQACLFLLVAFLFAAGCAPHAIIPVRETTKPAAAQDETPTTAPADFQNALKVAEMNLALPKGKGYEKEMEESVRPWLAAEVARCTKQFRSTVFGPFTVLVRVGKSGKAEEVLTWPETHIADCLKPKFIAADYPMPPEPSWWFKMDIRIKFKEPESGSSAPTQFQAPGGIVYGGELGVFVSAPKGWVLDNSSGVSQGVHAVMYPRGSSWQNAREVMYVTIAKIASGETLEAFVAKDVKKFKKEFLGIKIEELEPVVLRNGGKALVWSYSGGAYPNYECVAYALYGTGVASYVLTCRTQAGLEKTVSQFRDMVARSYPAKMKFEGKPPVVVPMEVEAPVRSTEDKSKTNNNDRKDAGTDHV